MFFLGIPHFREGNAKKSEFLVLNLMLSDLVLFQDNRRSDLMLLINRMPVIYIEFKKSGIPVRQTCNQVKKYVSVWGIFTGLCSLV